MKEKGKREREKSKKTQRTRYGTYLKTGIWFQINYILDPQAAFLSSISESTQTLASPYFFCMYKNSILMLRQKPTLCLIYSFLAASTFFQLSCGMLGTAQGRFWAFWQSLIVVL